MAHTVRLRHKETGILKNGFYGFSWTTLFFGAFPALFRQDFITFLGFFAVWVVVGVISFGFASVVLGIAWAFMYNKYYTTRLLQQGYVFDDTAHNVTAASLALGVALPDSPPVSQT
ncbi:hypothetical protein [Komagataeibacter sp. FNDCR2]|uniref:hypothetical protein n=1 Tax=Komagataeibacter sp. FNDCR2 TaxID=2878682 RepID=UPI001E48F9A5|nr:hypothetical protein [Komagataeibacter sp. FNDCR2]MCE2574367.1 hypothetical protein [Komagataeibacter sp. FNDCR2]